MNEPYFAMTTLVVPDYDEAIDFYVGKIGFTLVEDSNLGGGKRWVVVGAPGGGRLLLARASDERQRAAIGNQAGGRVGFFLQTPEFGRTFEEFTAAGVNFKEAPRREKYGSVAVFSDPFGNLWDLLGPA